MKFTHLHVHSHYSLLDGLPKIGNLVAKAKEYKMDSLAITDHGVMYGVIEFYKACLEASIKPIVGVEFYIAPNGRFSKQPKIDEGRYHLVLLAKNETGYKNLLKLTTLGHLEGFYYKPRIDFELIQKYSDGLIALTACLKGEIPHLIVIDKKEKAREIALLYNKIYGQGNFYLEVQDHPNLPEQKIVNQGIYELAKETGIPIVATNDIHYLNSDDAEAQDILLCLQTKKKLEDKDRMNMTGEDFSFRPAEQMVESFLEHPEAIANTQKIIEACNLEIELGRIRLPRFNVPEGMAPEKYLEKLCYKGVNKRYGFDFQENKPASRLGSDSSAIKQPNNDISTDITEQSIKERIGYELDVIEKTSFAPYFLIVADFVNWAKNNNIVVGPGRGSAAGSLVSYLLNITNIDPLKYDLLFERFLNPERISMPDIDLDFADNRRDEVIEYVSEKYGKDHVSQIITFGTMAARAAVRDVGRVLNISYNYCDQIAKMIPLLSDLETALKTNPELKNVYDSDPLAKKLINTAKRLEGVARHASTHACGVVITQEPLAEYIPLQFDSRSDGKNVVSQFSMKPIEDLGLLKMDFLGLKNLTIMERTIKKIKYSRGTDINIDEIPLTDKKTFELLRRADTTGVFQLESNGMKRYLLQLKPTELEDIIAMVALYRPGPMEWIPDYIAGKHGRKKTNYLHPKLAPILAKTHGVAIYQEQIMRIARDLAGFTLGEADILRKAMGKKIPELLAKQKEKFIKGCLRNGASEKIAKKVFAFIEPFAGYGFNRSHAACYAMIAYLTAYLKANFPAEFMASLLTSDQHDTDRIAIGVEECRKMGIEILAPDINESYKNFTVVKNNQGKTAIRFGLLAIKNVGENIIETLICERQENGIFQNLEDFLHRVQTKDLNKKSLESLIKAGALDKFGERNQMLHSLEILLNYNKNIQKEISSHQANLFGLISKDNLPTLRLQEIPAVDQQKKLSWEKELLGLYLSEHPFRKFEARLKEIAVSCALIPTAADQKNLSIKIAGVISNIQKVITRNGEPMLFTKIEDMTGAVEILVFPKTLKETAEIWQEEKMVVISGKISDKEGVPKILTDKVWEIKDGELEKIIKEIKDYSPFNGNGNYQNNPSGRPAYYGYQNSSINQNIDKTDKAADKDGPTPGRDGAHNFTKNNNSTKTKKIEITVPVGLNQEKSLALKSLLKNQNGADHKVYLSFRNPHNAVIQKMATNFFLDYNEELKQKIEQIIGKGTVALDK